MIIVSENLIEWQETETNEQINMTWNASQVIIEFVSNWGACSAKFGLFIVLVLVVNQRWVTKF